MGIFFKMHKYKNFRRDSRKYEKFWLIYSKNANSKLTFEIYVTKYYNYQFVEIWAEKSSSFFVLEFFRKC